MDLSKASHLKPSKPLVSRQQLRITAKWVHGKLCGNPFLIPEHSTYCLPDAKSALSVTKYFNINRCHSAVSWAATISQEKEKTRSALPITNTAVLAASPGWAKGYHPKLFLL